MKIILASVYHISTYCGGNEQYLNNLSLGLIKAKHKVFYLTSKAKNNYPYEIYSQSLPHLFGKPLVNLAWLKIIKKIKPDIFHASGSGLILALCGLYCKILKIPAILTYQANTNPKSLINKTAANLENILINLSFDHIITTTPHYQQQLQQKWPDKVITFIPMMVRNEITMSIIDKTTARKRLNISHKQKVVLFVGALSAHQYYKGADVLLRSAVNLPENFKIWIVGSGNKKNFYQKLSHDLKISQQVIFKGYIPDNLLPIYIKATDVLVLPSTSNSEGFGLVLIESMFLETPTITTKIIGSAPWFKKAKVTTLINQNDPPELTKAIIKVCQKPDKLLIKRAYNFAQQFSQKNMTEKSLNFYQNILKQK